ncbi:MAG: hybrid sensor histidine kinase/response regulator [Acidobacteria bacterium]|nr:MAG: hybrid sensor histidine kinase/response regulator [Acidobacteriota bacterium]
MSTDNTPEATMQKVAPSPWQRYGVAIWLSLFALLLTLLLQQPFQQNPQSPFLLFFGAVIVSAYYGGLGPALLTTAVSVLAGNYFLARPYSLILDVDSPLRLGVFALIALVISLLTNARKRAEEAVRESNNKLRVIIQASPLAIITLDLDGTVKMWNPAAERIFGWSEAETLGRPLPFIPAENQFEFDTLRERVLRGESFAGVEMCRERQDGALIDINISMAPMYSADGSVSSIMAVIADITERKQAEIDRRHLEEQLSQVQKMESIGTLAGGIAHDFNNLLTVILGYAQLSRAQPRTDEAMQDYLTNIESTAKYAASLTRQLLAFSHRQLLQRKTISLNRTIDNFMKMIRRIIGADVEVRLSTAPDLSPVFADPTQMEQVLMNLVSNARDAMPGGGELVIETHNVEFDEAYCREHHWAQPGHYVQLIVSDAGCGMKPEVERRIFEPFFTTKELGKGTGLGLSVVYGIVKQHDGLIEVCSKLGEGTSFRIYLPVAEKSAEVITDEIEPGVVRGSGETILVAEDEEGLCELARNILEGLGYNVLMARDGQEALELFSAHCKQIDLVVLDFVMPRMGGREVYERIRRMGSDVRVLFTTGYNAELAQTTILADADAMVVQKPYSVNELGHKVRSLLDGVSHQGN